MDIGNAIDQAHTKILDGSAAIRTLIGRASGKLSVPFKDIGTNPLPMIARHKLRIEEIGGVGDNRRIVARFSVFVEGNGADALAREIVGAIERAITQPAYVGQSVDACVLRRSRSEDPVEEPDGVRAMARSDITLEIWATTP